GELIVRAEYDYEYTNTSGRVVTIKEGEEFELVKKTNGDWWQVRRFGERKPIYVPALYVVAAPRKLDEDSRRLARDDAQIQTSESAKRSAEDVRKPPEEPSAGRCSPNIPGLNFIRVLYGKYEPGYNHNACQVVNVLVILVNNHMTFCSKDGHISKCCSWKRNMTSRELNGQLFSSLSLRNSVKVERCRKSGINIHLISRCTYQISVFQQTPPSGDLPPKVKRPDSPVYANLQDLKCEQLMCPTTSLPQSTVAGGQISGDGWETLFDAKSLRHYYYNRITRETSWKPPRKQGRDPKSDQNRMVSPTDEPLPPLPKEESSEVVSDSGYLPDCWERFFDENGDEFYIHQRALVKWWKSKDDTGEVYYYTEDGRTEWELPEYTASPLKQLELCKSKTLFLNAGEYCGIDNWRFINVDDISQGLEKAGMLNKTKITEGGKKLRKNWTNVWVVLVGHDLILYKDPKSHTGWKQGASNSKPECCIDLRGAHIEWTRDKSSKKNVCQLTVSGANEFLLQSDNDHTMQEWYQSIRSLIARLASTPDDGDVSGDDEPYEPSLRDKKDQRDSRKGHVFMLSTNEISDKKRSRLRKLITRRPTLQTLKDKGYIKEQVFGCPLACLCERENSMVPLFVRMCMIALEWQRLEIDGVYRVSGNQATIQKLRIMVDHDEHVDLDDSQWEDINVITGALKLFFRELPEPLVPYIFFEQFIAAIKIFEYHNRVKCMKDLINILPLPNHNTMKFLIRHLKTVVAHGEKNRMSMQNMAIVFAPTLLRPEVDPGNMAVHMVYQNQIVDLILGECDNIFGT
uniref:Rho GTPase activating protein 15 n=1 Tax=Petromyzon marinus TaxID=7757 RepID=S4RN69_PETMA